MGPHYTNLDLVKTIHEARIEDLQNTAAATRLAKERHSAAISQLISRLRARLANRPATNRSVPEVAPDRVFWV